MDGLKFIMVVVGTLVFTLQFIDLAEASHTPCKNLEGIFLDNCEFILELDMSIRDKEELIDQLYEQQEEYEESEDLEIMEYDKIEERRRHIKRRKKKI